MDSIRTFFEMGGYGVFVWPAFGVTVVLMAGLFAWSRVSLRADQRTLALLQEARKQRRRSGADDPGPSDE